MDGNNKRFAEFEDVKDCNSCVNYWDDTCDGAQFPKPCNSYKACRKDDIPGAIASLAARVDEIEKGLRIQAILFTGYVIINAVCWLLN